MTQEPSWPDPNRPDPNRLDPNRLERAEDTAGLPVDSHDPRFQPRNVADTADPRYPELIAANEPAAGVPVRRRLHAPLATLPVILANVAVFLAPFMLGLMAWDSMLPLTHPLGVEMGASLGDSRSLHEPWRLVTANFLHAGLIHLGCNMITLWSVGRWVESLLGPRRFLMVYVASGLGAVAASSMAGEPERVSLGASGAVLGVAWGVIVLLFRIRHALPAGVAKRSIFTLSLMLSLPLVLLPFFAPVDNWGHAGGSVVGVLVMIFMPMGRRPRSWWRVVSTLPFVAFVVFGVVAPIVIAVDVRTRGTELTATDTVDAASLRLAIGSSWSRTDESRQITWTSFSGVRAILEWDGRSRGRFSAERSVEEYEALLQQELASGRILGYDVFHKEDRFGEGVGGFIAAYIVTIPGDGWKGWITGRVEYRTVHAVRFFAGMEGPTRLMFTGSDSAVGRDMALEFVRRVEPLR